MSIHQHRLDDVFVESARKNLEKFDRDYLLKRLQSLNTLYPSNPTKSQIIDIIIREMRKGNYGTAPKSFLEIQKEEKERKKKKKMRIIMNRIKSIFPNPISLTLLYAFFMFLFSIFFFLMNNEKKGFCDSGIYSTSCFKCPAHANCSNGEAVCEYKYALYNKHCIYDDSNAEKISQLFETSLSLLMKKAGDYQCGFTNKDYITVDELDTLLYGENIVPTDEFNGLFPHVINLLEEEYSVSVQVFQNTKVFVSIESNKPASCIIKNFVKSYTLIFTLIVIFYTFIKELFRYILETKRKRKIAMVQAGIVYKEMKNFSTQIDGESLRQRFVNNPNITMKLWPHIEYCLRKTPFVVHRKINGINYYSFLST